MNKKHKARKNPFAKEAVEITLTYGQVRTTFESLRVLATTVRMPVKSALKARELLRALQPKAQDIQEILTQLTEQYGKRDDEGNLVQTVMGNQIATTLENPEGFVREEKELLEGHTVTFELAPLHLSRIWREIDKADMDVVMLDALLDAGLVIQDLYEDDSDEPGDPLDK